MPADAQAIVYRPELEELDDLARLLDTRFRIPLTPINFGLDSILGLVPGVGDILAAAPAVYVVWRGRQMGAPTSLQLRMLSNVGLDTVVGSIPVLGNIFDLFYKSNRRNIDLLRRHIESGPA